MELNLDNLVGTNGTIKPERIKAPGTIRRRGRRLAWLVANLGALSGARKLAVALGAIGCILLMLSLYHCTVALVVLTGSPLVLAVALAVGIDVGMVVSELAAIVGRDTKAHIWSTAYLVVSVLLSMILNAVANTLHAPERFQFAAIGTGIMVPFLVFLLAKSTAYLWER